LCACLDNSECTTVIPNNTILHLGNISRDGLSCVSPQDENDIGEWFYPNEELMTHLSWINIYRQNPPQDENDIGEWFYPKES